MKIKEMTINERPHEKALKYGIASLSNRELLAIILRNGTKSQSVLELGDTLLQEYQGFSNMSNATFQDLSKIKGIKETKALQLLACFEINRRLTLEKTQGSKIMNHPKEFVTWLNQEIGNQMQEHFLVVFLDTKNIMMKYKTIFIGTINMSLIHPREIYKEALHIGCAKIICVHNHPSGDVSASKEDILMTKRLQEVGDIVGIPLLDHIIVGKNNYLSFKEKLLMD